MKKNERLFLALGGVDEDLLQRCENSRGSRRRGLWAGVLAAAACLALILTALLPRTTGEDPNIVPPPDNNPPSIPIVVAPADDTVVFDPQSTEAVFHLLRFAEEAEESTGFTIYINEEIYALAELDGGYVVQPKDQPGISDLPPCELRIDHQPYLSMEEAKEQLPQRWREAYPELSDWVYGGLPL